MEAQIIVVDLGGQYTQLITRRIRELHVRSLILSPQAAGEILSSCKPKGIILSGGWASVYNTDAPEVPESVLTAGVPILGICLGMHWLAKTLGGGVASVPEKREYRVCEFYCAIKSDPLLYGIPKKSKVLMSYGDSVTVLPRGAYKSGKSSSCGIASFTIPERRIFAVQFHPECADTQAGVQIFKNFLDICNVIPDWDPACMVRQIRSEVLSLLPKTAKLLHFVSGGVNSTVLAKLLDPVLQDRLVCVTIDTGNLREDEMKEIRRNIIAAGCLFHCVDAKQQFMEALSGLVGGEKKRLAFQNVYRRKVEELKSLFKTPYTTQGTLATDLIESGETGDAALIKIHHNAGVNTINPLRHFFKDEVRAIGRSLGLPDFITERMPFPGPGLFIRIVDIPVTQESMDIVRWADARARQIIRASRHEQDISQCIVGIGLPTIGVKGDKRVEGYSALVRAAQSVDFMTGYGYEIPSSIRRLLINTLMQHAKIVRVLFDETPKPPATLEFE